MASKHNTRSDIHSGVSLTKSDAKWADQLNFRSSDNRTYVVPRRVKLLERDAGFHTIIHGIGSDNYALGSKESWMFQGNDQTEFIRLWRARLRQKILGKRTLEPLKVRGNYLGNSTETVVLTLVNNHLVLDSKWPPAPIVVEEVEPTPSVDCGHGGDFSGGNGGGFAMIVTDSVTAAVIPMAKVEVWKGRTLVTTKYTNAAGFVAFGLSGGKYIFKCSAAKYHSKRVIFNVSESVGTEEVQLDPDVGRFYHIKIRVQYSNTLGPVPGGHYCDSAVYKVTANDITIGWANLNNATDGGDRLVDLVISAEQAQEIVAGSDSTHLNLSLICDPSYPGFDLLAYDGLCHPNLAWVIVYNAEGTVLYDGAPVGLFLTITF